MNRQFDVIVYGDFLDKMTSQAENMREIIDILSERGLLGQVICRDARENSRYVRAIPAGAFLIKALTFLELKSGYNFRDFSQNTIFDFFASRHIRSHFVIASVFGLKRCLAITRRQSGVYIEMGLMESPIIFLEKLIAESSKYEVSVRKETVAFFKNSLMTLMSADYIIAISSFVKQSFVRSGYDAGRVFVSGLSISGASPLSSVRKKSLDGRFQVLYVAHTQVLKGLQYLLEAWTHLGDCNMDLVVVGLIDKNTEKIIRKYENLEGVSFVGSIKDTRQYYAAAGLFVLPTLSDGLGKSALEAMAHGIPVIVTDQCGIEITDGIEGFVIEAGNAILLEQKIRFCYQHQDTARKMGSAARATFLEKYSRTNYRKNLNESIDKIISYETDEGKNYTSRR
jgi:glycosyltransferase involved in cell wall biosynthesis